MKTTKAIAAFLLLAATFTACKKDSPENPEPASPTIDNIEIGLNNNETGVIGRDFHFNAEIIAGDKIENVQIKIQPKAGETYSKEWYHEISWTEYKGAKNATVHKHFDIPEDAAEGKYNFLIIINDQNGSKLEIKKNITIFAPANLPVDPQESLFTIYTETGPFYRKGEFTVPGARLKKGETFRSQVGINNVKGDGKLYVLLINKKHRHRPESIDAIDFNKVVVADVYEHKDWAAAATFSNSVFDAATFTVIRSIPPTLIGASNDNNVPTANPVNGSKAWESGDYYLGYIYLNSTYNISMFKYVEFGIDYN